MKRLLAAVALATVLWIPASLCLASQTASLVITVTIPHYPLLASIQPGCQFVVAPGVTSADCATTIQAWQPTIEPNGWQMTLTADSVVDPDSDAMVPASNVVLLPVGTINLKLGQAVDPIGGPSVPTGSVGQSFGIEQTILTAAPGFGNGVYQTEVHFRLTVPAGTPAGTYVPTWSIGVSTNAI